MYLSYALTSASFFFLSFAVNLAFLIFALISFCAFFATLISFSTVVTETSFEDFMYLSYGFLILSLDTFIWIVKLVAASDCVCATAVNADAAIAVAVTILIASFCS